MPAASEITVQTLARAGLSATYEACDTNGNYFTNDGMTFIHIKNANAGTPTLTIATANTVDGLAIADRTVTMFATTGDKMIGPLPASVYNDANGRVQLTYSAVTDLTIAVIKMPRN